MTDFVIFLKDFKEVIITGVTLVLTIVLIFIKRRPKTIDDFALALADVLNQLPLIINKVECPGNGLNKKKEARSIALSLVEKKLGRILSSSEEDIAFVSIDKQIESILSTPQKKGVELC